MLKYEVIERMAKTAVIGGSDFHATPLQSSLIRMLLDFGLEVVEGI